MTAGQEQKDPALHRIRRLLVTLDTTTAHLEALDDLAGLAARLEAEILALFVENTDLLDLVGYPVVTRYPTPSQIVFDSETAERTIRRHVATSRRAIEAAAQRLRVPVTFETRRGCTVFECARSAGRGDLIVVSRQAGGFARTSESTTLRAGPTAQDVIRDARHPVFVLGRARSLRGPLYIAFDGTPSSALALEFAAAIAARWENRDLIVFLLADNESRAEGLRRLVDRIVSSVAAPPTYVATTKDGIKALADALSTHSEDGVLVLGSDQAVAQKGLDDLLEQSGYSVLLLR